MRKKHTLNEYRDISADVWSVFKKYFSDDSDTAAIPDDIHELDQKYHEDPRMYEFFRKLMKVYFQELHELKEMKNAK